MKKRGAVVAILLLGAGLAFWRARPAVPVGAVSPVTAQKPPRFLPAPRLAGPPRIAVHTAQMIESITVEPTSPCRGEEVLVRVTAEAGVKIIVGAEPDNPAVLRFARSGRHDVRITARDWHDRIEHRHVAVDVRDCQGEPLRLEARRLGNGRVLFRAVAPGPARRYEWDFADGERLTTAAPVVGHDYTLRPQEQPTSTFLVSVVAGTMRARLPVTFVNAEHIAARSGAPTLPVAYDRFAARGATTLRIRNILADAVALDDAEVTTFGCDGAGKGRELTLSPQLSTRTLAARSLTELHFTLPLAALGSDVCRVQVWLRGKAGGELVRVPFALELGRPRDAVQVTDRARLAELRRAAQVLGRRQLTEDDLASVQR